KYLFVEITTNTGIKGVGEVGVWGFLDSTAEVIDKFRDYLVGKDPFNIEDHWNYLYRSMYFRGNIIMGALSAIDIALWDIKGKALGVPIYQLLGGKTRDKIRCYAVAFAYTPETIAKQCLNLKKLGFNAVRLMITKNIEDSSSSKVSKTFSQSIKDYLANIKACREAVGDDFDIILECHRSLTPAEAIVLSQRAAKYNPLFIEDPIAPDNVEMMQEVAEKSPIPVATGERNINIQEFEIQLQHHAAKYVRPDVCVVGGITAGKKIASIAEANYAQIVPHNPLGPISTAACIQLAASIPNFAIQEFPSFYFQGEESKMLKDSFEVHNGYITVPEKPGLGIELIKDVEEKYPVAQRNIKAQRAFDGSIVDV
ncbi:galactokinase, partial [Oenococcus oeni]